MSVIITCYKQARFLSAAITSVRNQTCQNYEIIVVDDGSPDDTAAVVATFQDVKYVRQSNCGCPAARNTGWKACTGKYIVFLDADDRLLKDALAIGVRSLDEHKDAALVFGRCHMIFADTGLGYVQGPQPTADLYCEMLKGCMIWHPASMMCRRSIFESGIDFDGSSPMCSDYDFYLKMAREHQIHCHNQVTSEYVQHQSNESYNLTAMMQGTLAILARQKPYLSEKPEYLAAYKAGINSAFDFIGHKLIDQLCMPHNQKSDRHRVLSALTAIVHDPRAIPRVLSVFQEAHKQGRIVCDRELVLRVFRALFS